MSTLDLGAAMRKKNTDYGPLADLVANMRESITEEVSRGIVTTVTAAITQALAGGITVAAPQVSVSAPDVTVTPTINVDIPGEDDAGEIAAIQAQTAVLEQINRKLDRLITIAATPLTRTVHRDSNGQITELTETR